jgi:lysylphosphatidylglycerol synthetase-like protein (DUF2156 family)
LRANAIKLAEFVEPAGLSKWDQLSPHLRQHGRGCMAYSTLQPGLDYFVSEHGYIAYCNFRHPWLARSGVYIVIGDPIVDTADFRLVLGEFLEQAPETIFLQIGEDCARALNERGFTVNRFGTETEIDMENFDLKGKYKAQLRHWINKAIKENVRISEHPIDAVSLDETHQLSRAWLERKGGHELVLLTRPLEYTREQDVRYFWAHRPGELIGMVIFDPMYDNGRIYGYYQNFVRLKKNTPHGTADLVTFKAMEKFKAEGATLLSLGLSPLSFPANEPFNANRVIHWLLKATRRYGNSIYPFKGNEFHKHRYRGIARDSFVASSHRSGFAQLGDLLIVIKALRVF